MYCGQSLPHSPLKDARWEVFIPIGKVLLQETHIVLKTKLRSCRLYVWGPARKTRCYSPARRGPGCFHIQEQEKNHVLSGYPLLLKAKYLDLLGWVAGAGWGGGGSGYGTG